MTRTPSLRCWVLADADRSVSAVDIKSIDQWFQVFDATESRRLNASLIEDPECAVYGATAVYNLTADIAHDVDPRSTEQCGQSRSDKGAVVGMRVIPSLSASKWSSGPVDSITTREIRPRSE